jgi:hypothetical protein
MAWPESLGAVAAFAGTVALIFAAALTDRAVVQRELLHPVNPFATR